MKLFFWKKKKPTRADKIKLAFEFRGRKFYVFKNFDSTLYDRFNNFIVCLAESDQAINSIDFKTMLDQIRDAVSKGDLTGINTICDYAEAYNYLNEKLKQVFKMADCLIILDDEPIECLSDKHTTIKARMFDEYKEVRAFFLGILSKANPIMGNLLKDTKEEDLNSKQKKEVERLFSSKVLQTNWLDYLKT